MRPRFLFIMGALAMTVAASVCAADELHVERFGVYLRVENLERSRVYYERVLGKAPYVTNDRLVGFDVAGGLLALFSGPGEQFPRGRNTVPYIRVPDADAAFERLRGLDVQLLDERVISEGPLKLFRFLDPDSNMLEIFSVAK